MSISAGILALVASVSTQANERYIDCVSLVDADIELGRTAAQQWALEGGGADAQHCLALADIAAGFAKLGAARLEDTAQRKDAGDDYVRARLFSQAADAWLQADQVDLADKAIKSAFELAPEAAELNLTAAKIYAAKEDWLQVIASVQAAAKGGFISSDAFVLSARAYFTLGDYESAATDVISALTIAPTNLDALVLRGEIQQTGVVIDVYVESPAGGK